VILLAWRVEERRKEGHRTAPNPRPKPIVQPELLRALEGVSLRSYKLKQNKDLFVRIYLAETSLKG
jgi:hypothetical protein